MKLPCNIIFMASSLPRILPRFDLFPRFSFFTHKPPLRSFLARRISIASLSSSSSDSASTSSSYPSIPTHPLAENLPPDRAVENLTDHSLHWVSPTASCGDIGLDDVGRRVRICGWVALRRIHGGLTFLNLRDDSGIVQVATLPDEYPEAHAIANKLEREWIIAVEGTVRARPSESVNKNIKTGAVEVVADHVLILNTVSCTLPFPITTADDLKDNLSEEIQLRYRVLDLRQPQMQFNLWLQYNAIESIKFFLKEQKFVEASSSEIGENYLQSFDICGSIDKNKAMVNSLQRYGIVKSKKVIKVMETVDRGLFVPSDTQAYIDSPMQIGYNATISAPHMHATCLELLEQHLQPGMRALDVGSGTGYLTACFAIMVGSQGLSVGLEHIPELASFSVGSITKSEASSLLKEGSLSIHISDGRFGWSELAPYDAIHVGAAAPEIPNALIQQLKPGGRMVIPVGTVFQDLKVVDKMIDGSIRIQSEASVRYVPLTSKDNQLHG